MFFNERTPSDLPERLGRRLQEARDVALFYYVGHGQAEDPDEQLCLGLTDSQSVFGRRATTSLTFDSVRRSLQQSDAAVKIVILDCCFAGLSVYNDGGLGVVVRATGAGVFTVAASDKSHSAWSETEQTAGVPHTYFTKYLAEIVEQGIAGQSAALRLDTIVERLVDRLKADGRTAPTYMNRDSGGSWLFARNAAYVPGDRSEHEEKSSSEAPPRPGPGGGPWTVRGPSAVRTLGPDQSKRTINAMAWLTHCYGVAFSPDGSYLATAAADFWVRVWNVKTGKVVRRLKRHFGRTRSVAFSPDGRTLAVAAGSEIRLWDWRNGEITKILFDHTGVVYSVAFTHDPDGEVLLASGSRDAAARLWNLKTGEVRRLKHARGDVRAVEFSPDDQTLASVGADESVRLWDTATGTLRHTLTGHQASVTSVAFSPDGRTVASGSWDKTVRLWTRETGIANEPLGHDGSVYDVAFTPDGRYLASVDTNYVIWLWDLANAGLRIDSIGVGGLVGAIAISPDGSVLAGVQSDGQLRRWGIHGSSIAPS
ncbi:caspase family protein [Catenulispora yoronensis]